MNKKILIKVEDGETYNQDHGYIRRDEYPNIMEKANENQLTLNQVIDFLTKYMSENHSRLLVIDLDDIEFTYSPVKKMTIAKIEKELGYKIKIIKEK